MRQNNTPVDFPTTVRGDKAKVMTSGRAGKVQPVDFIPLLRGDSMSGKFAFDIMLKEMPRPLLNNVTVRAQAWFVPKSAHPQFSGYDEFMHAYQGEDIRALGQPDRTPPPIMFHDTPDYTDNGSGTPKWADPDDPAYLEMIHKLGLHPNGSFCGDLVDAYNVVYNYRLAAHSSKLQLVDYFTDSLTNSTALKRAFWPSSRQSRMVPDYEKALVVGDLDLDVQSGQLPISGIGPGGGASQDTNTSVIDADVGTTTYAHAYSGSTVKMRTDSSYEPDVYAEMANQIVGTSLADIDKARTTQEFAKIRQVYAGNETTGYSNDDAIIAELMQGFRVPQEQFKRPWLLDSKNIPIGMVERHATDAANLDSSVTTGRAGASLSLNVPQQDAGGVVIITIEVVPDRLFEAQFDDWFHTLTVADYPDALRDIQRTEPVDTVFNKRIDARHTNPDQIFGFEPMNDKWNRDFVRLGGDYFQPDPANPFTDQRSGIWQASVVDPQFTEDHWLVPDPFPHYPFADTQGSAFEIVARHECAIRGITLIGDVLQEDNGEFVQVEGEQQ